MPGAFGPSAVLRVEGVEILVVSNPMQITDLRQFKSNRVDPLAKRTVAPKSMQHFRAAYEPIADQVIVCDSGALASPDIFRLRQEKRRRNDRRRAAAWGRNSALSRAGIPEARARVDTRHNGRGTPRCSSAWAPEPRTSR